MGRGKYYSVDHRICEVFNTFLLSFDEFNLYSIPIIKSIGIRDHEKMLRLYESYNFARSFRAMDLQYAGESSSETSGNHLLDQSQSYGGTICFNKIIINQNIKLLPYR